MRERSCGGKLLLSAEVVKWQTRTFEGRVAQAVRVQVPPSAPKYSCSQHIVRSSRFDKLTAGFDKPVLSLADALRANGF